MDSYIQNIIRDSYKHLELALEYSNRFLETHDRPDLESAKCHVIDAMANLEQTGIFERDALLKKNEYPSEKRGDTPAGFDCSNCGGPIFKVNHDDYWHYWCPDCGADSADRDEDSENKGIDES